MVKGKFEMFYGLWASLEVEMPRRDLYGALPWATWVRNMDKGRHGQRKHAEVGEGVSLF